MPDASLTALLFGLGQREGRAAAAARLAEHLGASAVVVLVRDVDTGALVPAAGFRQTLPGGPTWLAFLARCTEPGFHTGEVAWPDVDTIQPAAACTGADGTVMLAVGGRPRPFTADEMLLPLLGPLLRAETEASMARGMAAVAEESARHANLLAGALDSARHQLEGAIAERERLNRDLERAAHFREQLLGVTSHDLRNPLAAITAGVESMRRRGALKEIDLETVARISRSADRMRRMIDELLDLTRARLGHGIPISPQAADMHELCRHAVSELNLAHPDRVVELHVIGSGEVTVDPDRMVQVLSNLLANAHIHGQSGTPIRLLSDGTAGDMRVEVRNRGRPIPPHALPHIFDAFFQASERSGRIGLGLGLFIAQQIVDAHRGRIDVQSSEEAGTAFTVTLPRSVPVPAA